MPVTLTCERCGKTFTKAPSDAKGRRFCSQACFRPPRPPLICERCGKAFYRIPSEAKRARFCSLECCRVTRPLVTCQRCGREYVVPFGSRGKFCSAACKRNRVTKTCLNCGKSFEIKTSHADEYSCCSAACRDERYGATYRPCAYCGQSFKVPKRYAETAKYCSRACQQEAGRTTIICAYCGKEKRLPTHRVERDGTRCCSNRCATLLRMQEGFDPGYCGVKKRTGYRTDIEALAERVLISLGVPCLFEHKIGRYMIDFALQSERIALECDGWHHNLPQNRERDAIRDAYLTDRGWRVIRIPDKALRQDAWKAVTMALGLAIPMSQLDRQLSLFPK